MKGIALFVKCKTDDNMLTLYNAELKLVTNTFNRVRVRDQPSVVLWSSQGAAGWLPQLHPLTGLCITEREVLGQPSPSMCKKCS